MRGYVNGRKWVRAATTLTPAELVDDKEFFSVVVPNKHIYSYVL